MELSENLKQRILSGIVLAPVVLLAIYCGGTLFFALMIVAAILMSYEWRIIIHHPTAAAHEGIWQVAGVFYIALPVLSLVWIRTHENGLAILLWLLCCVWATDIAAYAAGRAIGGWRLAPSISPNKTWAGLGGAVVGAALVSLIVAWIADFSDPLFLSMVAGVLAVLSQAGDLLESWIKRHFGVKDSGHIIPGHGGILDRVDGIVTVAPVVAFLLLVDGGALFAS